MRIDKLELLNSLQTIVDNSAEAARALRKLPEAQLGYKVSAQSWSALECIEHLNLFGDYYLPEIEKRILEQKAGHNTDVFHSGPIGNYFAKLMKVSEGKMTRMPSPKQQDPRRSTVSITTLDRFLKQMDRLSLLLKLARTSDLTRIKTSISLTPLIKTRLGDTFRFHIYHIERHILQAQRAVSEALVAQRA